MLRAVSWDSFRIVPLVTGDLSRRCALDRRRRAGSAGVPAC
jgi:hypothetical protein